MHKQIEQLHDAELALIIDYVKNVHEKYYVELKKSRELPSSFWETYSSFSNTSGGLIILGVEEASPENIIHGVQNPNKIITELWNHVSNKQKASIRNIDNGDIQTIDVDENRQIIFIFVKELPESAKPLYINNKKDNVYIRTGDGDRKATNDELQAFYRNSNPVQDSLFVEHATLNDLDPRSIANFQSIVSSRNDKNHFEDMSPKDFLTKVGACGIDRADGKWKIKYGTLLFLGKHNAIKDFFPHYHLDYFNRRGNNPRWIDRISDDEISDYEMNIFNFFNLTIAKLQAILQDSFRLDENQIRIPKSNFDETLRECLANCLCHADYTQGYPSLKIEVYDGWFKFSNPGKMLVSRQQFFNGGDSRPRNETIMKLFRLIGVSERQGFGGQLIYRSAVENHYRLPEVTTNIEKTEVIVWNIDLVDSYPDLSEHDKNVLKYAMKHTGFFTVNDICDDLGISKYQALKSIHSLKSRELLTQYGKARSTQYGVSVGTPEMITHLQIMLDFLRKNISEMHI